MKCVENESTHVDVRSGCAVWNDVSKVELMQVNEHVSSKPYFKYTKVSQQEKEPEIVF